MQRKLYWCGKNWQGTFWSAAIAVLGWAVTSLPAAAAEKLILRIGPFEQSIAVADLETFAKTGELSPGLKNYAPFLTPQVQEILSRRLQVDPEVADKFVDNLLQSPEAADIIKKIGLALPKSTAEQISGALSLALRQANGLSFISFVRAFPAESITVDASEALKVALSLNPSYWQSQAVGPLLEKELTVTDSNFRPSFDPTVPGRQTVQRQTLNFNDRQRQRFIPADIYWAKDTTGPLVVISHGFASDRGFLTYTAEHLASYGFTVVALEHPGSNVAWLNGVSISGKPSELIAPAEYVNRPKDISFLLDELAKLNQKEGQWQGKFNTEQVSVIGHSLGGYTALALAGGKINLRELRQFCERQEPLAKIGADWVQCAAAELPDSALSLADSRVKQAIALNPLVGMLFGKTGLSEVKVPTLIFAATEDAITPALSHQLQPFQQLPAPKYLIAAIGATHLSISHSAYLNYKDPGTTRTLANERMGKETRPLHQLIKGTSLAFIQQLTPEAEAYAQFLTPAYAQSVSGGEIPLRLTTKLPEAVTAWFQTAKKPKQGE